MPSPFPGMDPYLEDDQLWPAFHHQLVMCLYQLMTQSLGDRYRARVGQRHYVTEQALFTSVVREEHHEDYIEIRHRNDGRLVTLVDMVSPCNKTTHAGRTAYHGKRQEGRAANANLVELDLVLQGQPMIDYTRDGLPDWDYTVTVTRPVLPEQHEIYSTTLQKKLPSFKLPMATGETEKVYDLQQTFARCYDQGGFGSKVDYAKEPLAVVQDDDRRWLRDILRRHKLQ